MQTLFARPGQALARAFRSGGNALHGSVQRQMWRTSVRLLGRNPEGDEECGLYKIPDEFVYHRIAWGAEERK